MLAYERPEGELSLTNPDYPIYGQNCGGKLYDSDDDAAVGFYKGRIHAERKGSFNE